MKKIVSILTITAMATTSLGATAFATEDATAVDATVADPNVVMHAQESTHTSMFATVDAIGEDNVTAKTAEGETIVFNVGEPTVIIDNESGELKTLEDIEVGSEIFVIHSLAMTRSIPAQSPAYVIATNVDSEDAETVAPTMFTVGSISEEEGTISLHDTLGNYIIRVSEESEFLSDITTINEGDTVLAWFGIMTLSMPAQAHADSIMVIDAAEEVAVATNLSVAEFYIAVAGGIFGDMGEIMDTHYATGYMNKALEVGLVSEEVYGNMEAWNEAITVAEMDAVFAMLDELVVEDVDFDAEEIKANVDALMVSGLTVNGTEIATAPFVREGVLMVPLREVAETLGFTVTWDEATRSVMVENEEVSTKVELGYDFYEVDSADSDEIVELTFGTAPLLSNEKTFVPVGLFDELVGEDAIVAE